MIIAVDIDGIITWENKGHDYENRTPRQTMIRWLRELKEQGHYIKLFTARFLEDREVTERWLKHFHVPYDELILGKIMIFFAAGDWSTEYYLKVCMELNISKLWSYYHERSRIEKSEKSPPYQWYLIDSGAFSYNLMGMNKIFPLNIKPIEKYAEDYHAAIENCERKDFLFVELDACFHFTEKQLTNIANRFRERRHYLRVYHPMADGGTLEIVRKWIDEGWTYIAVANDGLDYLDALFSITRDKIKVHGFAMTKTKILDRYPFYPVDSTTPLSTVRYGHRVLKSRGLHSNGFLVTKHDAIEMRLANVLNNNETRIRTALQEFKKLEQYYTELWKARGITWPATPWETNNG